MNKKIGIVLAIVAIIIIVGIVSVFVWLSVDKQNQTINQITSEPIDTQINAQTQATGNFIREIPELGIRLLFPERWKDVQININSEKTVVSFSLPTCEVQDRCYRGVFSIANGNPCNEDAVFCTWKSFKNTAKNSFYWNGAPDDEGYVGFSPVEPNSIYEGPLWDVQNKILPSFTVLSSRGNGFFIPELSLEIPVDSPLKEALAYKNSVNTDLEYQETIDPNSFDIFSKIQGEECLLGVVYSVEKDAVYGTDYFGKIIGLTDDKLVIWINAQATCSEKMEIATVGTQQLHWLESAVLNVTVISQ